MMKTRTMATNVPPGTTTQGCPQTWRNRRGQVVALSHATVRLFATQAEADAWLRAGGKRQQPKKSGATSNTEVEVNDVRKMAAVCVTTGKPVALSAEARQRIEKELNAHGDLEGLEVFATAEGHLRYAKAPKPYFDLENYRRRTQRQK